MILAPDAMVRRKTREGNGREEKGKEEGKRRENMSFGF